MKGSAIDGRRLRSVAERLGDLVVDPSVWPEFLGDICEAVAATGAVLFQSDVRTPDVPRTASFDEFANIYFQRLLHVGDIRALRATPKLVGGMPVVIDQDLVTPEEMQSDLMYQELSSYKFQWFAGVGFWADAALWGLCIQRTSAEGSFEESDKHELAPFSDRLTEIATLSTAVGRIALSSNTSALQAVKNPAVAILDANAAAADLFDDNLYIRGGRLFAADPQAQSALQNLLDRMRTMPDTAPLLVEPFVARRRGKPPIIIRVLPVHGAARSPFLGARVLLTFSTPQEKAAHDPKLLVKAFALTPAEARLATLIGQGHSPEQVAEELGIARATIRNQLKVVFAKTDTHRQSELVALLARL